MQALKKLTHSLKLAGLAVIMCGSLLSFAAPVVYADLSDTACQGFQDALGSGGGCNEEGGEEINSTLETVVNIMSVVVAIIAVIMIIIAGFRYVTSGGDSGSVSGAKDTVIYAIVGLIIVALAQLIVRFVVSKIGGE